MSVKSRPLGTNATGLPFAPRWAAADHGRVFLAGACRLGGRVQLSYVAWLLSVFPVSHKHRKVPPSTCYLRYIASSSEDRRDALPPRCDVISRLPVHAPRLGCLSGARTDHGHAHPGGLKDLLVLGSCQPFDILSPPPLHSSRQHRPTCRGNRPPETGRGVTWCVSIAVPACQGFPVAPEITLSPNIFCCSGSQTTGIIPSCCEVCTSSFRLTHASFYHGSTVDFYMRLNSRKSW